MSLLLTSKIFHRSATLFKKRLWHRCFPVNFAKFWRKLFLQNISSGCFLRHWKKDHNRKNMHCSMDGLQLYLKETPTKVFSYENSIFKDHLRINASQPWMFPENFQTFFRIVPSKTSLGGCSYFYDKDQIHMSIFSRDKVSLLVMDASSQFY